MGLRRKSPWGQVAEFADHQGGIVSRRQLLEIGMSAAAVDHALITGRMHPTFRGVFSLGHAHRERNSDAGYMTASPARALRATIIDCAGGCRGASGESRLRRLIELAAVAGHLNVPEIKAVLANGPRRRGSPLLRLILEDWRDHEPSTRLRSRMEAKMLPLLVRYGLPPAECNVWVKAGAGRYEVDFLWRRWHLIVETDSAKYHDNPEARRRDDDRNRALPAAGYRLLRLRWSDLEYHPAKSMAELANHLQLHLT